MSMNDPTPLISKVLAITSRAVVTNLHTTPRSIIVAFDSGTVKTFNAEGQDDRMFKPSEKAIWALDTWSAGEEEDEWLAVGGVDCEIGVWKVWKLGDDLDKRATLRGHTNTVRCLAFVSRTTLLSGSRDTTLRLWDISTSTCSAVLAGHTHTVRDLAVCANTAVSVSYDHTARVWNLEKKECVHVLRGHEEKLYAVAFDGKRIATGSMDKMVRVWDPVSGVCLAVLEGHTSLVSQLQLNGSILISAGADGEIRLWSLEDFGCLKDFVAHGNAVTSLQSNGEVIVSGGSDGMAKVWSLNTGDLMAEIVSADAVWKVGMIEQKLVVLFSRNDEVTLEIWGLTAST